MKHDIKPPEFDKVSEDLGYKMLSPLNIIFAFIIIASILIGAFCSNVEANVEANVSVNTVIHTDIYIINDFIKSLEPNLDPDISISISRSIERWCNEYNLPYSLVIGLIYAETFPKFNILSKSNKGCIGLMQINHSVWKNEIEDMQNMKISELYHIDNNIKIGCIILKKYLNETNNPTEALEKYVGGSNKRYVIDIYEKVVMWEINKQNDKVVEDGGEQNREQN